MKTIVLLAEKGGSGKSTVATHLAVCAARRGRTAVILDLDPQRSAMSWSDRRGDARTPVTVATASAQELPGLLADAREQGADFVLLDTPGRADVTSHHALAAADLALVPCRPSIFDLESATKTVAMIQSAGRKGFVVLNACPSRGARAVEARDALTDVLPVAPVELHQLVAFSDALNDGQSVEELEPSGKAAQEISALYDWLLTV